MSRTSQILAEDSLYLPEYFHDLTVLHTIGRGRSGRVYLAENPGGKKAALKVTFCSTPHLTNSAIREFAFLQRLTGSFRVLNAYDFRLETSPRGTMTAWLLEESAEVLSVNDPRLTARDRLAAAISVCEALIDCRRMGIAHLDIKQSNVFRGYDGVWKLGDFSHSARIGHLGRIRGTVGSPGYMAPEIYAEHRYSQQSDIYSTGVLIYRLFTGALPFPCDELHPSRGPGDELPRTDLSYPLWQILLKATAPRPEDRYPTFEALRNDLRALHARDLPRDSAILSFTRPVPEEGRSGEESLPHTMGHTFSFENRPDSAYWFAEDTWSTDGGAFD